MIHRVIALAGLAVVAGACGPVGVPGAPDGQPAPPPAPPPQPVVIVGGVAYSAETSVTATAPTAVRTTARATNATAGRNQVTFPDGCVVLLRAYREPARTGTPAWDQQRAVACTLALVTVTLDPGETEQFSSTAMAAQILGDSLPEGRYYFTAFLRPDNQPVEVTAGEADLRR